MNLIKNFANCCVAIAFGIIYISLEILSFLVIMGSLLVIFGLALSPFLIALYVIIINII